LTYTNVGSFLPQNNQTKLILIWGEENFSRAFKREMEQEWLKTRLQKIDICATI
jgi:hypothetical protein